MKFVSVNPSIAQFLEAANISPLVSVIVAVVIAVIIANKKASRG